MILNIEKRGEKLLVTAYADYGFRRELEVDFVLYGPNGKYSISEGVLEGVTAFEIVEMDGKELKRRGLPAEEGRKYRALVIFRW
jgi:hypothetical protein